jgi:pyrroline-5-carboxylate reductase
LKPDSLVLSLAPKIGIADMTRELDGFERIVRMIPNACSIINAGYNPMVFSDAIPRSEREAFTALFQNLGECPEVPEEHLEAYAILSAMGPTYFWFQLHELQELGKSFGLPEAAVKESLKKMLSGALKTLYESSLSYEESLDLIPVKPLQDDEAIIKNIYRERLTTLYNKIKR